MHERPEQAIFCLFKQKTAYEITRRDWSSDVCSSDLSLLGRCRSSVTAASGFLTVTVSSRGRFLAAFITSIVASGSRRKTDSMPIANCCAVQVCSDERGERHHRSQPSDGTVGRVLRIQRSDLEHRRAG